MLSGLHQAMRQCAKRRLIEQVGGRRFPRSATADMKGSRTNSLRLEETEQGASNPPDVPDSQFQARFDFKQIAARDTRQFRASPQGLVNHAGQGLVNHDGR
jgi:hypothetical protein